LIAATTIRIDGQVNRFQGNSRMIRLTKRINFQ
jgi:hypothetical protein